MEGFSMPRVSNGPRYWKTKKGWYACLNNEKIRLTTGPKKATKKEAKERYDAEKASRMAEVAMDRNTVYAVLVSYLKNCENRIAIGEFAESTLQMHRAAIMSFNELHGNTIIRDLRPQHVTGWLAAMRKERWSAKSKRNTKWGDGTARLARSALRTAFIWAKDEAGIITSHPFDRKGGKVKKEKRHRREPSDNKVAITENEHALLLEIAAKRSNHLDFYHLLQFLYATGARPAEMYGAKASEWDEALRAFVIPATPESRGRYKLAHLGKDRVVYIPPELVPTARELMAKYPEGPIFRTERGSPWSTPAICSRMTILKKSANEEARKRGKAEVRKQVGAYAYRHGFVTRWIKEGRDKNHLCLLLDTSEAMLRQHYNHLFRNTDSLMESLNSFSAGAGAKSPKPENHADAGAAGKSSE
jgi:integrase